MRRSATAAKYLLIPAFALLGLTINLQSAIHHPGSIINRTSAADRRRVDTAFENMPLHFIENRGQVDPGVAYYLQGRDTTAYFTTQGVTFVLAGATNDQSASREQWALKLDFLDANPAVKLKAQQPTAATVSYFNGRRGNWKTGLATYAKLVYEDLWPGIDLIYTGSANRLKYSFAVKPGADPDRIRLGYRGAASVRLNEAGQLEVSTPAGGFHDDKPFSYQEVDGSKVEVATSYYLNKGTSGEQAYGFRMNAYDKSRLLIVDPAVIVYAGFIGGSGDERALGIAVDSNGSVYVTGATTSLNFPLLAGPNQTFGGAEDVFLAKLNAVGTLVYAGFIGGTGDDVGFGIAVDGAGNAYVTGATSSTQASFPVTVGPDPTYNGGAFDVFVAKVNPTGTALVYCGYIGGAGTDGGTSISVGSAGDAFITGCTTSTETSFPVTVGPDLTYNGGTVFGDAFVAKLNPAGTALDYCGYVGGSGEDAGIGIALDSSGNAYVSGGTTSTEATFPVKVGPDLTYNGGLRDGFVARVNPTGTALDYCGYIGGAGADTAFRIAVDGSGNAYVTGDTSSTEATFPVKVGPDLSYNGGAFDAFVAKVNSAGTGLDYCGYLGGSARDAGVGIAVDSSGNAYVTGQTASANFPVTVGPGLTFNGGGFLGDSFVAKVNGAGTALVYCGFIGGSDDDAGYGIAVDGAGNAYVAGETSSPNFPAIGGPDLGYNGGFRDGFVAKIATHRPPVASCKNLTKPTDDNCQARLTAQEINDGSSDPDGDPITLALDPAGPFAPGTHNLTLTVTDSTGASSSCSAVLTVVDQGRPTINACPANRTLRADANCKSALPNLTGEALATDNCSAVTVTQSPAVGTLFGLGPHSITLTASDDAGNSSSCTATLTVVDQTPPAITAPPPITVTTGLGAGLCGTFISNAVLGNATASDNCSVTTARSGVPAGNFFPVGTSVITYTATDSAGNRSFATQNVTVNDDTPPLISSASVDKPTLWPPNHQMVDVTVSYTARDNCGSVNTALSISSNEPVNGGGDGNTTRDWEIVDTHHVRLRAERSGQGNGRIYTIRITAADSHGNTSNQTVSVSVPHN